MQTFINDEEGKKALTYADVFRGGESSILVDNLVTGKETQDVVEVLESLNDTEDLLVVAGVVGGPGLLAVQGAGGEGRVDIENHVDSSRVEDGDTLVVVKAGLQVVDTDGVDLVGPISKSLPMAAEDHSHPDAA